MSELLRTDCGLVGERKEHPDFFDAIDSARHIGCQGDLHERLIDELTDDLFDDRFVVEVSELAALPKDHRWPCENMRRYDNDPRRTRS